MFIKIMLSKFENPCNAATKVILVNKLKFLLKFKYTID